MYNKSILYWVYKYVHVHGLCFKNLDSCYPIVKVWVKHNIIERIWTEIDSLKSVPVYQNLTE